MEAEGFNPINARARSAFSCLNDIEGVESIGVVSALGDAEDVSDVVRGLRFQRVIVTGMDRTYPLGAARLPPRHLRRQPGAHHARASHR